MKEEEFDVARKVFNRLNPIILGDDVAGREEQGNMVKQVFREKLGYNLDAYNRGDYSKELKDKYGFTLTGTEVVQFEAENRWTWDVLATLRDKENRDPLQKTDEAKQATFLINKSLAERDAILLGQIMERGVSANLLALKEQDDKSFFESMLPVFEATKEERIALANELHAAKVSEVVCEECSLPAQDGQ